MVAQLARHTGSMVDAPIKMRRKLCPVGAKLADLRLSLKGRLYIATREPQRFARHHRVFNRLACILIQILQHRMRCVAQQRPTPVGPVLDRFTVAQLPYFVAAGHIVQSQPAGKNATPLIASVRPNDSNMQKMHHQCFGCHVVPGRSFRARRPSSALMRSGNTACWSMRA